MKLADFYRGYDLQFTVERVDENPNALDWQDADHWRCVFTRRDDHGKRRRLTVYFSQGYGHEGREPNPVDVLACLASDTAGIENALGFEDWAEEYGYDPDSREAERTYRITERQARKLAAFLDGPGCYTPYDTLLWHTERE